ncbi:VWA domain-containing protein [Myxococcaceae bacterium GXIMD 01537]
MTRRISRTLLVTGLLASLWVGCTDTLVEPLVQQQSHLDDRLTVRGRVCTDPPDPSGFPVKVVLVIDQSGSMCVSDPPGAQEASGFCQRAEIEAIIPPGVTEPARVRALRRLLEQFRDQGNVQVSIAPFETNVKNVWPPSATGNRFGAARDVSDAYIRGLQNQLGKGTDYQGALGYAYGLIAADIQAVSQANPAELPRTRYVVVFLTDGTPFPRCSANDGLPQSSYATPDSPDLLWSDSFGAGDFCNLTDPDPEADAIDGFEVGTDRNQNYQLFSFVRRLMELKEQNNVGDVRMNTVLLFNEEAVRACGPICQDIYGQYPNTPQAQYPQAAKKIASWLLRRFAEMGNGVYQEFNNTAEISGLGLGTLDYSSFASRNVMKTLMVQALSSSPGTTSREVDSDGDGIPDALDTSFELKTNPFEADSDRDCFSDGFERLHADQGFSPAASRDTRGCDPAPPLTASCTNRDTDGDGLTECEEMYLRTRTGIVDSDGDGVPDGLESRWGLDPLKSHPAGIDTDGDGVPDATELFAGSDPTRRDRAFFESFGYQYEVQAQPQADESICYDFSVSNLQLVTPPDRAGRQQGYNLFKVWFGSAPESGVATDYGIWRTACAWAQYAPPGVRVPLGPELSLEDGNFRRPEQLDTATDYQRHCVGLAPGATP